MTQLDPKRLRSKAEAKAQLGLASDSALNRLIRSGKLRVVKFSKTSPLRFRQMDIDACLESCAVTGPGEDAWPVATPPPPAPSAAEMRKEQSNEH